MVPRDNKNGDSSPKYNNTIKQKCTLISAVKLQKIPSNDWIVKFNEKNPDVGLTKPCLKV